MIDDCSTLIAKIIKIAEARWLRPCDAPGHVWAALTNRPSAIAAVQ
jgi:hypothetical protein